ncbi:hypothetical protein L2E82_26230 [Cichorium intybus]|uniref:Uncharacterized protein n=1 Tax=Cichorium intybus TaxID=13427 RepID=A0ACB9E650_CICIN|nr:hypothetical protein L2E82_26230 [Cichorium intybus]
MSKIIRVLFMVVVSMAITIVLTTTFISDNHKTSLPESLVVKPFSKRVGRFLAENNNPRAADHCKKDDEICYILEGKNSTCCNNKCMDLSEDKHNCGACKNKCKFTKSCCRGECVNLAYDKRNCGSCGNKCMPGGYCIYGLCNYA